MRVSLVGRMYANAHSCEIVIGLLGANDSILVEDERTSFRIVLDII